MLAGIVTQANWEGHPSLLATPHCKSCTLSLLCDHTPSSVDQTPGPDTYQLNADALTTLPSAVLCAGS